MKTLRRLDNALSEYEDMLWLLRLITRTQGQDVDHIPEPSELRESVERRDFRSSMDICQALVDAGPGYKFSFDFASDLGDWCHYSRRVFSISESLCDMLLATDLPDFPLGITKFVAQSYIIYLQKPVKTNDGREHDFILCSFCPNTGGLSIRSYPKTYDTYVPLTDKVKEEMEWNAERGNRHFKKFVDDVTKASRSRFVVGYTCFLTKDGSLKQNIINGAPDMEREDWILIYKLALGVNLYLQSARSKSDTESVIEVKGSGKREPRGSVTEGTSIFELSASKAFTSHGHRTSSDEDSTCEVRPHFRRGFWRRPNGLGNDPDAPATIWVRPTWVRKDKIQDGESPIGSFQKTSPVE